MLKQIYLALVLGCSALLLASCTAKDEPKVDVPPRKEITQETPSAKPDWREVTLHVEGMSERLNLI